MSLAYIRFLESGIGGQPTFFIDTGSNPYYQIKAWKEKPAGAAQREWTNGDFTSAVQKNSRAGRHLIPTHALWRPNIDISTKKLEYFQLCTYATPGKKGPAYSDFLKVQNMEVEIPTLPKLTFSMTTNKLSTVATKYYEPVHYSESKAFPALLSAIPGLISQVAPIATKLLPMISQGLPMLTNLLGAAGSAAGAMPDLSKILPGASGGAAAPQNGANVQTPQISIETLNALAEILKKIQTPQNVSTASTINPAMLASLGPILEKLVSPETIKAIGDQPVKLFGAIADGVLKFNKQEMDHLEKINPGVDEPKEVMDILAGMSLSTSKSNYSQAQIAPALLAALPALMPVIEKVLDPKTIEALGDQPVKLLTAISDGVLKFNKQEMEHLEKINPGVDEPKGVMDILASMSMSMAIPAAIKFKYVKQADITFLRAKQVTFNGKTKVVYQQNQIARFPFAVTLQRKNSGEVAPYHFQKVVVQWILKHPVTLEVMLQKTFKLKDLYAGKEIVEVYLSPEELKQLPIHEDIKGELSFIWYSDKAKRNVGTFKNHYFSIADMFVFDREGALIQPDIPLNNIQRHRAFWHKIWSAGSMKARRVEFNIEAKYICGVQTKKDDIERMETRMAKLSDNQDDEKSESRRKVRLKLKSGFYASLSAMNELLVMLGHTPWNPAQLEALKTETFTAKTIQEGRSQMEFRARGHEAMALWVYPEIDIINIHLKTPAKVNDLGLIEAWDEAVLPFPRFKSIHFIGTKTE